MDSNHLLPENNSMVLDSRQTKRLVVRIEHLLSFRNGEEFTAAELAEILEADAHDVLFALLQMSSIERATRSDNGVTDCWCIRAIPSRYIFEQVRTMLLADCR